MIIDMMMKVMKMMVMMMMIKVLMMTNNVRKYNKPIALEIFLCMFFFSSSHDKVLNLGKSL